MINYVFDMGNLSNEDHVKILDLDELSGEFGIDIVSTEFCYVEGVCNIGGEPSDVNIHDLFGFIWHKWRSELIIASVTSRESRFQEWIDAVSLFPESHITFINKRDRIGGEYTCAYMTIPSRLYFSKE